MSIEMTGRRCQRKLWLVCYESLCFRSDLTFEFDLKLSYLCTLSEAAKLDDVCQSHLYFYLTFDDDDS